MQNIDRLNSFLYPAENCVPTFILGQGYEIKVEIYGTNAKVQRVSAYNFHPYKTTLWENIKNWFTELLYGRTAILVKVEGEPSALYVRVDELSRKLNISSETIRKQISGEDATDFLVSHQIEKTIEKIQRVAKKIALWSQIEQKSIEKVIEHVGYKNIFEVVDHNQFESEIMVSTLINIGKELANYTSHDSLDDVYEFKITSPDIFIWKIKQSKKLQINLRNLAFIIEELPKPQVPLLIANKTVSLIDRVSKLFQPDPILKKQKHEFKNMARSLGVNPKNMRHLKSLANRVSYANLNEVFAHLEEDAKIIMMNTCIDIGQQLSTPVFLDGIFANFRLKYKGRRKEGEKQLTYAFALNKKDILINQSLIDKGTSKFISNAIKLNNLDEPFVRIKLNKPVDTMTGEQIDFTQTQALEAAKSLREEATFLEKLHKNKDDKGCSSIVVPFTCEMMSNKKQNPIFFQRQYKGGNGNNLKGASAIHQLYALRDVASALSFIHRLEYVHMDMKTANFMLEGDVRSQIPVKGKLSDFGMTVKKGSFSPGGTILYSPYEAFYKGRPYFNPFCIVNEKIDSFGLGVTILDILDDTPQIVFGLLTQSQIDQEITDYKQRFKHSHPKDEIPLKLAMLDVTHALLQRHSMQRITCEEAAARLEAIIQNHIAVN